ncbi:hypothetical protein [Photobacterium indicum]|nr:hypothetical protein [Photobacterium indicum]
MVAILTDYIHLDRFAVRRLSFVIRNVERFPNVSERALYNRIVGQYILAVNTGTLGQDRHEIKQMLIDGRNALRGDG